MKKKKLITDYNTKQELIDYINKLVDITILIDPNLYIRPSSNSLKSSNKSDLIGFYTEVVMTILNSKVERQSTFFWNDKTSDSIKQDLYNMIGENHQEVDDFIDSEYFDSFWENKIIEYKIKVMDCKIFRILFSYEIKRKYTFPGKREIVKKWKRYKDIHQKVDLFDDDEPFH